jgi:hypothetical protein
LILTLFAYRTVSSDLPERRKREREREKTIRLVTWVINERDLLADKTEKERGQQEGLENQAEDNEKEKSLNYFLSGLEIPTTYS